MAVTKAKIEADAPKGNTPTEDAPETATAQDGHCNCPSHPDPVEKPDRTVDAKINEAIAHNEAHPDAPVEVPDRKWECRCRRCGYLYP